MNMSKFRGVTASAAVIGLLAACAGTRGQDGSGGTVISPPQVALDTNAAVSVTSATAPGRAVSPVAVTGAGTYVGSSDTNPPAGSTPCPPQQCSGLCASAAPLPVFPLQSTCHLSVAPVIYAGVTMQQAPTCVADDPNHPQYIPVAEIRISQVLAACSQANGGVAQICIQMGCTPCMLYVYETIPFQYFYHGMPLAGGGRAPICGVSYSLGGGTGPFNSYYDVYSCGLVPGPTIPLQVDCDAFNTVLQQYASAGLYSSTPSATSYLDPNSVVFVVMAKCCAVDDCDCPPPFPDQVIDGVVIADGGGDGGVVFGDVAVIHYETGVTHLAARSSGGGYPGIVVSSLPPAGEAGVLGAQRADGTGVAPSGEAEGLLDSVQDEGDAYGRPGGGDEGPVSDMEQDARCGEACIADAAGEITHGPILDIDTQTVTIEFSVPEENVDQVIDCLTRCGFDVSDG